MILKIVLPARGPRAQTFDYNGPMKAVDESVGMSEGSKRVMFLRLLATTGANQHREKEKWS